MKIFPLTDFPERFLKLKSLYLYDESKQVFIKNKDFFVFDVDDAEMIGENIKLKLKDYDSINEIQNFAGKFILIEESQKKKLAKGQHYFHELIDFGVYAGNELIGKVAAFENYGGDDLMKIKDLKNEDKYIPYRKEFIEKIDEKEKRIYINVIEGLI